MSEAAAITGILAGYRTTKDGGLTVTIELDEFQASKFHAGFSQINVPVAVVRLRDGSVETTD